VLLLPNYGRKTAVEPYPLEVARAKISLQKCLGHGATQPPNDAMFLTANSILVDDVAKHAGHRWTTVGVPVGATIDSAYMSIFINSSLLDEPQHQLRGEKAANPGTFTSTGNNIDSRSRTTATINWDSTGLGANADEEWRWGAPAGSPSSGAEIKTIVQEIVDQAGWAQNNAVVLIYEQHTQDTARDLSCHSYDGNTAFAAKLHIEYTAAAAGNPWYSYAQQ